MQRRVTAIVIARLRRQAPDPEYRQRPEERFNFPGYRRVEALKLLNKTLISQLNLRPVTPAPTDTQRLRENVRCDRELLTGERSRAMCQTVDGPSAMLFATGIEVSDNR